MWRLYIKINIYCIYLKNGKIWKHVSVQFSHLLIADSLWPYGLQQTRLPCPSPTPRACSNSCPSSWWCHPTISFSVIPFSFCLQSFPASGSFTHVYLSTIWLNCWEGYCKKSIYLDDKDAPPQHLCLSPAFHSFMSSDWPLETSELWLRRKHRCFDYQQKPAVFLPKIMFSLWKDQHSNCGFLLPLLWGKFVFCFLFFVFCFF